MNENFLMRLYHQMEEPFSQPHLDQTTSQASWPRRLLLSKATQTQPRLRVHTEKARLEWTFHIQPVPLMPSTARAVVVAGEAQLATLDLYSENLPSLHQLGLKPGNLVSAIKFVPIARPLSKQGAVELLQDVLDAIYVKEFPVQREGEFRVAFTRQNGNKWLITPPGLPNGLALWAYAGVFKPGALLSQMEPLFFSVLYAHQNTYIDIVSAHQLIQAQVDPHTGGLMNNRTVVMMEREASFDSLAEDIVQGKVTFKAAYQGRNSVFHSVAYEAVDVDKWKIIFEA